MIGTHCTVAGTVFSSNDRITIGDYALIQQDGDRGLLRGLLRMLTSRDPGSKIEGRNTRSGSVMTSGSALAIILGGATIGDGAIVGAGAVVLTEVPGGAIVAGNLAHLVGWAGRRRK